MKGLILTLLFCVGVHGAQVILPVLATNGPAVLTPVVFELGTNGLNGTNGINGTNGVNGTNVTTGNFTNAVYFHTNNVSLTALAAGFTNGSFALVTISNALQAMWMSNNVVRWKS